MKKLKITVGKKSYEVTVEVLSDDANRPTAPPPFYGSTPAAASGPQPAPIKSTPSAAPVPGASGAVASPMAGQVKSILVTEGDAVEKGQVLIILEAMKMDNKITAPIAGTVGGVAVKEGDTVAEGHVLLVLE